jgi:hydrogenase nickel incorporation protein HypA/HybF
VRQAEVTPRPEYRYLYWGMRAAIPVETARDYKRRSLPTRLARFRPCSELWYNAPMHELAVTESIMDIAVRHAKQAGAQRILVINLVIGDLTGFVDDSIQFYFDFLSKDTIAQSARLNIERVAARVRCHVCGAEYAPPDSRLWTCPECNALGGDVIGGKEFSVASIEIE